MEEKIKKYVDALRLRFGAELNEPSTEAAELTERSLPEIARLCCTDEGLEVPVSDYEVVRSSFDTAGTLFSSVLSTALNKSFLALYDAAQPTWKRWCNSTELSTLEGDRIEIEPIASPPQVPPGQQFPKSSQHGLIEKVLILKSGFLFDVTLEAILADDVGLIQRLLRDHVAACIRREDDLCYAALESPGNIDGTWFFHANWGNLKTGVALGEDNLAAALTALRNQKTGDNVKLQLRPAALIVPTALESTARKLVVALYNVDDPDWLDVIVESHLTSTTTWYVAADKAQCDSLVMGFLERHRQPQIRPIKAFEIDGRRYRVKHLAGCKAVFPRSMIKNTT